MTKISVIIPAYNYGHYLGQAIDSVLRQRFDDYEVIVVDDCSTDSTAEVLATYAADPRLRIVSHAENQGFIRSCHEAIGLAEGDYIIRVDADDFLDENALLVLSSALDANSELGLVYSDFTTVTADGEVLEYVRLPRARVEDELMDIPANGAMMMFRKSCYETVGGYDLTLSSQDGYDLWLKFRNRFAIDNVNLPLFYYRQHGANYGRDSQRILDSRRAAKQARVDAEQLAIPNVLGVVPAFAAGRGGVDPLAKLGDKSLLSRAIEEAMKTSTIDRLVCVTDDGPAMDVARECGAEVAHVPTHAAETSIQRTILHVLTELAADRRRRIEAVAVLSPFSPFRRAKHIDEAINTLLLFPADSVLSVRQDPGRHYRHGHRGLSPLSDNESLKNERDTLYQENGAIYLSMVEVITERSLLGKTIGHVLMTKEESIYIETESDAQVAGQILK